MYVKKFYIKYNTQAENFIRTVGTDIKGRLLPVVDVEYYGDKEQNPPNKEDVVRELKVIWKIKKKSPQVQGFSG